MKKGVLEKQKTLMIFMLIMGAIKLLMTSNLPIIAQPDAGYDDGLMVNLANSLVHFKWLGGYSHVTLIKGPFFPFFLAVCHWTGLPFLMAQNIFYMLACMFFVCACKDLFKTKKILYVMYLILLFNPVTFSSETFQRVYRNGIVMAQELFVLGAMIAVFLKVYEPVKKWVFWMVIGGIGLVTMWYNRDDSIWILPFIVVASIVILVMVAKKEGLKKPFIQKIVVLFTPFIMLFLVSTAISTINYSLYGVYTVTETSGTNFAKAIKAMYAVEDEENVPYVSVSRKKMQTLYTVSPTLAGIKDTLEPILDYWEGSGRIPGDGEVEDGWFYWAIRQAVAQEGYYSSGRSAEEFWSSVANEIDAAQKAGAVKTRGTMPSALMSPWREGYMEQLLTTMGEANRFVTSFDRIGPGGSIAVSWAGTQDRIEFMETMTSQKAIYPTTPNLIFSGWFIWADESETVHLQVVLDERVDLIEFTPSPDVIAVPHLQGINDAMAENCRFATTLEELSLESGAMLQVVNEEGAILHEIPLDGSVINESPEEYVIFIEVLANEKSQEHFKNAADSTVGMLNVIVDIYGKFASLVYKLSIVCFIILIIEVILGLRKKKYDNVPTLVITSGLILSYIVFIAGVSYTHISAFSSMAYMYLSSAYPVVLAVEGILVLRLLEKAIMAIKKIEISAHKLPCKKPLK